MLFNNDQDEEDKFDISLRSGEKLDHEQGIQTPFEVDGTHKGVATTSYDLTIEKDNFDKLTMKQLFSFAEHELTSKQASCCESKQFCFINNSNKIYYVNSSYSNDQ